MARSASPPGRGWTVLASVDDHRRPRLERGRFLPSCPFPPVVGDVRKDFVRDGRSEPRSAQRPTQVGDLGSGPRGVTMNHPHRLEHRVVCPESSGPVNRLRKVGPRPAPLLDLTRRQRGEQKLACRLFTHSEVPQPPLRPVRVGERHLQELNVSGKREPQDGCALDLVIGKLPDAHAVLGNDSTFCRSSIAALCAAASRGLYERSVTLTSECLKSREAA